MKVFVARRTGVVGTRLEPLLGEGNGAAVRSFTHVDDLAMATIAAIATVDPAATASRSCLNRA